MTPLTTGIVAAIVLAAIVAVAVCFLVAARLDAPTAAAVPAPKLPSGADAALWSIVEAVPDPRNHLALTRDLSGEVHITTSDRDAMAALFADEPRIERLPRSRAESREPVRARSHEGRRLAPTNEGREDLTLSGQLFFSGQPELNRF